MIRYMTAGESHGEALIAIIDGIPSGLQIDKAFIDHELKRRMAGYGRGGRMKIESDEARILSGVRKGMTIGSPISLLIRNKDFSINKMPSITKARPGHADLAGALKYNNGDIRNILERASARETAARVAAGAIAKMLLGEFDIDLLSHVTSIGKVKAVLTDLTFLKIKLLSESSELRCADRFATKLMKEKIDIARKNGDSLGGVFEVIVRGVPAGLGSHVQWDRRLDGNLAKAVMSIPAVKGVEIGAGFRLAHLRGSLAHDEISYEKNTFTHHTNKAGGIEGGMTNGENILIRAAMKPIATLMTPLMSVDIKTKKPVKAQVERADVCAVPACGVVAEAVTAIEIANAFVEKFGGDSIVEIKRNYSGYKKQIRDF